MTSDRMVWNSYFSVVLPNGWEHEEGSGVISLFHPNGAGALQVSFARSSGDAIGDLRDWNQRFANSEGLGAVHAIMCVVGGFESATFETAMDDCVPNYWRVWHCGARERVATITYNSSAEDRDVERHAVDEIIASIEWLW